MLLGCLMLAPLGCSGGDVTKPAEDAVIKAREADNQEAQQSASANDAAASKAAASNSGEAR
jgi:hypothetical protein